jgi:Spy/CpxP family protein refolding chaperone
VTRCSFAKWAAPWAASIALCAGAALAQPGPEPGGPGIERMLERNAERLHLDDATRDRIRELAEAGRAKTRPQRQALQQLHESMHALLTADAPEESVVLAKADEIGRAETALHKERLRTMLAIRALLTPEQRSELVKIHEEFRAAHPESGHHGAGGWRDRGERE